jgi:TetR/AcrR family transcriptional regulator, transcriptional repressor for nem operon
VADRRLQGLLLLIDVAGLALTSTADVRVDVGMSRPSNKDKLLTDGLRLVHQRGFGASSVRDIAEAARVPLGSFTNHFASKEAFGLEILERYREMTSAAVRATLRNDRLPPLRRLRAWIDGQLAFLRKDDMRPGCLYGNLSAEASEASDAIRFRVASVFAENQKSVAYCLEAAINAGELAPKTDVQELAGFIVSSLQGAILVAKSQRSPIPVERFERVLFRHLLPQGAPPAKRRARRTAR